jgi:hypothetical protein
MDMIFYEMDDYEKYLVAAVFIIFLLRGAINQRYLIIIMFKIDVISCSVNLIDWWYYAFNTSYNWLLRECWHICRSLRLLGDLFYICL